MVQFDGATGDRESKPYTPAGSVSVFLDSIERLEDFAQGIGGDAWAVVPDADDYEAATCRQFDLDVALRRRVPDRVA